jgi:hypothetical protein
VLLGATGILMPVTVNKFSTKATDKFTQSKGKQVPNALEGEAPVAFEEDRIIKSPPSETIEGAGLSATLLQTYEEHYEINTAFWDKHVSGPAQGRPGRHGRVEWLRPRGSCTVGSPCLAS